jgi:hypothetical protein
VVFVFYCFLLISAKFCVVKTSNPFWSALTVTANFNLKQQFFNSSQSRPQRGGKSLNFNTIIFKPRGRDAG